MDPEEAGLAARAKIVPRWKYKLFACIILRQPKLFPLDEQTANETTNFANSIHATHPHRKDTEYWWPRPTVPLDPLNASDTHERSRYGARRRDWQPKWVGSRIAEAAPVSAQKPLRDLQRREPIAHGVDNPPASENVPSAIAA
jgi:hypothetical protein